MDYDAEEEAYNARLRRWGMHDKKNEDTTIQDCLDDLAVLMKIHGETLKGIIIIPMYDHFDMQEFEKKYKNASDMDTPPHHSYLCSGGVPLFEAIGAMESAKLKILS